MLGFISDNGRNRRTYQMLARVDLTKGKLVVVLVVQDVQQRRQERVKLVQQRKGRQDLGQALGERFPCKLHLREMSV